MNYYSYRLIIREHEENHILKCRQLFHQYIVDMYAKIETTFVIPGGASYTRTREIATSN
jgi:hypothetical protein